LAEEAIAKVGLKVLSPKTIDYEECQDFKVIFLKKEYDKYYYLENLNRFNA
jgi:hypothetical protein